MNPLKADYFLRVKNGSGLATILDAATESNKPLSDTDLARLGGMKKWQWLLRTMKPEFDNLQVFYKDNENAIQYIDVVGRQQTVVQVEQAEFSGAGAGKAYNEDFEQVRWPTAPPMIQEMDFFRKPNYFETMRTLVANGSHIAMAGPPGVGKDTAVMQLAAEEQVPLVVVGADAGLRKRDLIGSVELQNGSSYFQISEAAAAAVNGWWLLITEINAAEPDTILLLNSLMAPPHSINIHGKQYPVHPNFRLFVTFNPGLVGTKPLPQSFRDRFYSIQVSFLSETELRNRLEAHGMLAIQSVNGEYTWSEQIVRFGQALWKAHEDGKIRYQVTVRRLKDAVQLMNLDVTSGDVKKALRLAVISAIDSPVESKVAEQVLTEVMNQQPNNSFESNWN